MRILALDLGKFKTVACDYDSDTVRAEYETSEMTPGAIEKMIARRSPDRVVVEIGPGAGWVHDIVVSMGIEMQVANASQEGWRWRNVKRKTDKVDALKLARLSAVDQIAPVHMPEPKVRQWRSLIAYRSTAVKRCTQCKNRIRSILHSQGISMKLGRLGWTFESLGRLHRMACRWDKPLLDELWRGELYEELEALDEATSRLVRVERKLTELSKKDPRVKRLQTIPGVGPRTAEALVALIDNPQRFRSGKQISSYVGLVPRQFDSGQMARNGRITKQGNPLLRQLLVEVSWSALKYNPGLRSVYERVKAGSRKRRKIAIVAVARKLLVTAWAMLRDDAAWRIPKPVLAIAVRDGATVR